MTTKLLFIFFAFVLVLPIINAKRCNSCCESCSPHIRRADKLQNELTKIKKSRLNIGVNFELSVSTIDGKHIGFIQDVYEPSMTIPPNSQIYITSRIPKFRDDTSSFVRIFYDINHKGLFTDLPIPGNYTVSQISLPYRSMSSILIPSGYQAILYDCDHFSGKSIILTSSQKDVGNFNDKMVSMEIMKIYEETPEHVAIIHSHPNYIGKKIGIEIGESLEIEISKINSIMIRPGYQLFVYDNNTLIDIYSSNFTNSPTVYQTFLATVIAKKSTSEYAVFYNDIDYNGPHFTVLNPPITYNQTNGKLSSMKIPLNHEVILYDEENMQGVHIILSGEVPNLNIYLFNDRAMTIVYREKQTESIKYAEIYTKPNFRGERRILPMGYSIIKEEIYVGSVKVPSGLFVNIKKSSVYPLNFERQYMYISDCDDSRYFVDTPLISVNVGKF